MSAVPFFDNAACDLVTRVSGWLSGEVVCLGMDDHGAAEDICECQLLDIDTHPCVAVAGSDRRQIAGVIGMWLMFGIVVRACICKIVCTVSGFMDMKSVEGRDILWCVEWQMEKFCIDNDPMIGRVVEFYHAGYLGIRLVAAD